MPNPNDKRPTREPMTDDPGQRPSRSPGQDPNEEDSQYGGGERQAPGYNEPDTGDRETEDENTRRRRVD